MYTDLLVIRFIASFGHATKMQIFWMDMSSHKWVHGGRTIKYMFMINKFLPVEH